MLGFTRSEKLTFSLLAPLIRFWLFQIWFFLKFSDLGLYIGSSWSHFHFNVELIVSWWLWICRSTSPTPSASPPSVDFPVTWIFRAKSFSGSIDQGISQVGSLTIAQCTKGTDLLSLALALTWPHSLSLCQHSLITQVTYLSLSLSPWY